MNILLIEDDKITAAYLRRIFQKRGHQSTHCTSAEGGWAALQDNTFEMAFVDVNLPGRSGLDFCRDIRQLPNGSKFYVLVGTGEVGSEALAGILEAGADDYIAKPYQLSLLNVRMAVAEKRVEEIQALQAAQAELTFLARHDPLTRLWNRWELIPSITRASRTVTEDRPSSMLLLDLDHFKEINDLCGHQAGDRVLIQVAGILQENLPQTAWAIRYGGDEFIAVLPGVSTGQAVEVSEKLLTGINDLDLTDCAGSVRPGGSIGIAPITAGIVPEEAIKQADAACYRAKSQGKNRAEVFVNFDSTLLHSKYRAKKPATPDPSKLHRALELYFQPVCNLADGSILFQEALLRFIGWQHADAVQAGMFLSQINDRAYARSLDQFVAEEICYYLRDFQYLNASINISAASIGDWHFAENLLHLLEINAIDGKRLILEITETQVIEDIKMARMVLDRIRSVGVRVALDDFGSGFSSIVSLKKLPIDLVKLDGELTINVQRERFNQVMIEAVVGMARGIGFLTVAERIETETEMEFARSHGVGYGQGYLFGKPRPIPWKPAEIPASLFQPAQAQTAAADC